MRKYLLEDMTWEEAGEALQEHKMVLIPVGSIEQHGRHLPLGTDYWVAKELGKRVAEKTGLPTLPAIPVGYADYHADFPGTLTLSRETYAQLLYEICMGVVQWGVTHILFVSGHGGNLVSCKEVGAKLREQGVMTGVVEWWHVAGHLKDDWALIGHGDKHETSLSMVVNPDAVRMDRVEVPTHKTLSEDMELSLGASKFKGLPVHIVLRTKDIVDGGNILEPEVFPGTDCSVPATEASVEEGEEVYEAVASFISEFAMSFKECSYEQF